MKLKTSGKSIQAHTPTVTLKTAERERKIFKVTLVGSVVNVVLTVFKFIAGIAGHSAAMTADAVHSLSDLLTDGVVLLFVHISDKPEDCSHDYGHGKYETLATTLIGIALAAVAVGIGYHAVRSGLVWWSWFTNTPSTTLVTSIHLPSKPTPGITAAMHSRHSARWRASAEPYCWATAGRCSTLWHRWS